MIRRMKAARNKRWVLQPWYTMSRAYEDLPKHSVIDTGIVVDRKYYKEPNHLFVVKLEEPMLKPYEGNNYFFRPVLTERVFLQTIRDLRQHYVPEREAT